MLIRNFINTGINNLRTNQYIADSLDEILGIERPDNDLLFNLIQFGESDHSSIEFYLDVPMDVEGDHFLATTVEKIRRLIYKDKILLTTLELAKESKDKNKQYSFIGLEHGIEFRIDLEV